MLSRKRGEAGREASCPPNSPFGLQFWVSSTHSQGGMWKYFKHLLFSAAFPESSFPAHQKFSALPPLGHCCDKLHSRPSGFPDRPHIPHKPHPVHPQPLFLRFHITTHRASHPHMCSRTSGTFSSDSNTLKHLLSMRKGNIGVDC